MNSPGYLKDESRLFFSSLRISVYMVLLLWLVHLSNFLLQGMLFSLGTRPRNTEFWYSIFTGPLIHGDIPHLLSNSVPLLICGTLLFWLYRPVAWTSFGLLYILTGTAVWIFARPVLHIGFSGVVYGLVSFLFWVGLFKRDIRSIVISLVILVAYSGYFAGIYPNQDGISWESHLLGGVVGIVVAAMLSSRIPKPPQDESEIIYDEVVEEKDYFLPRDVFDPKDNELDDNPFWISDDTKE
jgi:membrane associated rhomboid family serine protease